MELCSLVPCWYLWQFAKGSALALKIAKKKINWATLPLRWLSWLSVGLSISCYLNWWLMIVALCLVNWHSTALAPALPCGLCLDPSWCICMWLFVYLVCHVWGVRECQCLGNCACVSVSCRSSIPTKTCSVNLKANNHSKGERTHIAQYWVTVDPLLCHQWCLNIRIMLLTGQFFSSFYPKPGEYGFSWILRQQITLAWDLPTTQGRGTVHTLLQ